jgi:hypothetical protein
MNATPQQIVRCLMRDMRGDWKAAEHYAHRMASWMSKHNPGKAQQYREAARLIAEERRSQKRN